MLGSIFAVLAAVFFAGNTILIRRAVLRVSDASLGTLVSVPMGVPLFFIAVIVTGKIGDLFRFSWQETVWLSLAGILHYVVGRSLNYGCVQLVGANIAGTLRRTNILVSVALGVALLGEPLSWKLAAGVALILTGITLTGLSPQAFRGADGKIARIPFKAVLFGFGCGLAWGISPIFVKLGLEGTGAAIPGAFISFLAATVSLGITLIGRRRRTDVDQLTPMTAGMFFGAGIFSFSANLVRYLALSLAPASVVTPLASTEPVFVMIFSFIFNRQLEIFSRPVIIGSLLVMAGTILLL
ncbi:MAG: DMT family transporter [Thermodesulfobacteriota bacterium]